MTGLTSEDGAMPPSPEGAPAPQLAALLFARRAAFAAASAQCRGSGDGEHHPVGIADLARFLTDPEMLLSVAQQRYLFSKPRLRADFQALKRRLRLPEMAKSAAASDGAVLMRRFDGGTVKVHDSRIPNHVYVMLLLANGSVTPQAILLENAAGVIKRRLPSPDSFGKVMLVLDRANTPDADFLSRITDPACTGAFVT